MSAATVTILMATRNGGPYLEAQLASFLAQECSDWALWVSDDASTDGTRARLEAFCAAHPQRTIRLLDGPGRGAAANFLALLCHPDLPEAPVALADQDDVWLPHRLSRALLVLATERSLPMLYGSATWVTDADLGQRHLSRHRMPRPAFGNALVQNVIGGNTMVLNPAALRLVRQASQGWVAAGRTVPHHDWWLYLVMTGAGAAIHIDPEPGLLYRQHDHNVMGASEGTRALWQRLRVAARGCYGKWIRQNAEALAAVAPFLTPRNRQVLADFRACLGLGGLRRLMVLRRLGVHRETMAGTLALYLAALTGRV